MIPALLGLIAPVAAVKVFTQLARAAGAALKSATTRTPLQVPPVVEKAAEVSEQTQKSPVIFAYDGMSRRTKITELTNGTVTSKKLYWWLGGSIVCERDGLVAGFPITKRYFGQGEVRGTTKLFYTFDHLGSIRELLDSSGVVQAVYRYSTYGERAKLSGNLESDWGYAGLWHHQASGLDLATYRVYDAANKRWISRDPLGEGVDYNLYRYCGNNPVSNIDPMGLEPRGLTPSETARVQAAADAIRAMGQNGDANNLENLLINGRVRINDDIGNADARGGAGGVDMREQFLTEGPHFAPKDYADKWITYSIVEVLLHELQHVQDGFDGKSCPTKRHEQIYKRSIRILTEYRKKLKLTPNPNPDTLRILQDMIDRSNARYQNWRSQGRPS